ncbi:MAG: hypothetical protein RL385_4617 [Pseudomonadota bacterium]|jgi:hypothetical protein
MTPDQEPISWLMLERYALGELSAEERTLIDARLSTSAEDRALLASIVAGGAELPPLPASAPISTAAERATRRPVGRVVLFGGMLATAAVALLVFMTGTEPAPYAGVKGSGVSLRIISDRQGPEPKTFASGERFKVAVTCAAQPAHSLRLLVFQGGERFEPLPEHAPPCGNLVEWPGAFALDGGDPADVCLYWGTNHEPRPDAAELTCLRLTPR